MTDDQLRQFINDKIRAVPGRQFTECEPVGNLSITPAKMFAFAEMNSIEDTDIVLCMDGVKFMGQPLKIRQPRDYARPLGVRTHLRRTPL
jgi:hypothetical protein